MKFLGFFFVVSLVILIAAGCLASQQLTICGTGDSQELLRILAKNYSADHPGVIIDIPDSIGSSGGIRKTAEDKCDIGRTARPLRKKEKVYGLTYRLFAYTPVVFVTNHSVRLDNITTEQVIALFKGEINNWRQLGTDDAILYIAVRYHGDSSRTVLEQNIPALNDFIDWAGTVTYSTPETVDAVVKHDHTIAFLPLAMAVQNDLNILRYNGLQPSPENIRSETYPLIVPLGLVWKGSLKGLARDFVDYIFSDQGKRIIADNGAVPGN